MIEKIINQHLIPIFEIDKLSITCNNADITMNSTDGEKIVIHELMSRRNLKYLFDVELRERVLSINQEKYFRIPITRIELQLSIPKSFSGEIEIFNQNGTFSLHDPNRNYALQIIHKKNQLNSTN